MGISINWNACPNSCDAHSRCCASGDPDRSLSPCLIRRGVRRNSGSVDAGKRGGSPHPKRPVTTAIKLLRKAERPIVYKGGGVIYAGAMAELKTFVTGESSPRSRPKAHSPRTIPCSSGFAAITQSAKRSILAVGSSLTPGCFSHGIAAAIHGQSAYLEFMPPVPCLWRVAPGRELTQPFDTEVM